MQDYAISTQTIRTQTSRTQKRARSFWLKQLHTWHWISSAISLIGLLLFAFTGITLNHAADIEGSPVVVERAAQLPPDLIARLADPDGADSGSTAENRRLPDAVADWVADEFDGARPTKAEWSDDEVYLPLPRPGGDGWVAINRDTGAVTSETTSRGWISYLNDLHKGRNAGTAWKWFIDIFSVACFLFALTGLLLLQMHSAKRRSTWPLVGLGLAVPVLLAMVFIH